MLDSYFKELQKNANPIKKRKVDQEEDDEVIMDPVS